MLSIKPGVDIRGIKPEALLGVMIIQSVYHEFGGDTTITSGLEGRHKTGSKHYDGFAVDIRFFEYMGARIPKFNSLLKQLKEALGDDFDVIQESDHIHVEYDPK